MSLLNEQLSAEEIQEHIKRAGLGSLLRRLFFTRKHKLVRTWDFRRSGLRAHAQSA